MKSFSLLIALLLIRSPVFSQDKLLLMNGAEVLCNITDEASTVIIFETTKKNGKVKKREVHKSDVFSYTLENNAELILYVQDSLFGDIYTEDQMLMYMAGQYDGRNNFKALPTAVVGFVICGAAAALGGDGLLTAIGPPMIYTIFQLAPKIHIREKYMTNKNYKYNELYAAGFEPPARSRKMLAALSGGYAGSAAALILYYIVK